MDQRQCDRRIVVASHGTTYADARAHDIGAVERAVQAAYPGWVVRRAFTSQPIIDRIRANGGEKVDNLGQVLQRAVDEGARTLVILPTHLLRGAEYERLVATADRFRNMMTIAIAEPLLGVAGANVGTANPNPSLRAVTEAVATATARDAGYDSVLAAAEDGCALVLVGHGSVHEASAVYDQMQTEATRLGYGNVFVGTIEGEPADTSCEATVRKVLTAGYAKAQLRPLMLVAGAHANKDMAGSGPESWKSRFEAAGIQATAQIKGLGQVTAVQQVYVRQVADAMQGVVE